MTVFIGRFRILEACDRGGLKVFLGQPKKIIGNKYL
jgi:hypothetical protein